MRKVLGVDIGGSGIKAAPVNTKKGELIKNRQRFPTPQPSTPEAVAETVADLVERFGWKGPIGCAFPAIVKGGVFHKNQLGRRKARARRRFAQTWAAREGRSLRLSQLSVAWAAAEGHHRREVEPCRAHGAACLPGRWTCQPATERRRPSSTRWPDCSTAT